MCSALRFIKQTLSLSLIGLIGLVALTGCVKDRLSTPEREAFQPVVAFVPLRIDPILAINNEEDLSRELTRCFRDDIELSGCLCLLPDDDVICRASTTETADFFNPDYPFKKQFCDAEFVVIIELIDHEIALITPSTDCENFELDLIKEQFVIKMRLKVVNISQRNACIVLQKEVEEKFPLPSRFENRVAAMQEAYRLIIENVSDLLEYVIQKG